MNKEQILNNLDKLISAINEQKNQLSDTEGKVPKQDMDKMLSNIRALYETFTVFNYLNTYGPADKVMEADAVILEDTQFENLTELQNEPTPTDNQDSKNKHTVDEATVVEVVENIIETKAEDITEGVTKTQTDSFLVEPIQSASINDSKADKQEMTLAEKLRRQKITDLNKAISIADKFLYMNELFEGENEAYKTVISTLNDLNDKDKAEQYLSELGKLYQWNYEDKTVIKLIELTQRKFS
jgi:hypothetical protein